MSEAEKQRKPQSPKRQAHLAKLAQQKLKHGACRNNAAGTLELTPEYVAWKGMRDRCRHSTRPDYPHYGGRGIQVCERWQTDFAAFLADVGPRPSKYHSLDRYPDVNGNYEPGNVRWATYKEQCRNRRNTLYLTINGETKPLIEWAEIAGIRADTLRARFHSGWPEGDILHAPNLHREHAANKVQEIIDGLD